MVSRMQLAAARGLAGVVVVVVTLFYPAGAYASETPGTETTTTPTTTETQPPATDPAPAPAPESQPQAASTAQPAPAAAPASAKSTVSAPSAKKKQEKPKYTYNEATGRWENGTYAWDPNTGQTKPLNAPDYSYNKDTEAWDTTDWRYDPAAGKYVPNTVSMTQQPDNGVAVDGDDSQFFDLYYNANISNNVYSSAVSGDASVIGNTIGGSALTGDALTIANIFNMLNSSLGLSGTGQIATFSSDVYGDVYGDLYIDPSALAATQPASSINGSNANVEVNAELDNKIENNITLDARSGNAAVSGNTQAGNATSGSADAVANIVNMLNSAISTGSSFIGLLNIYGNLNGDILFPAGLLDYLIAANGSASHSGDTSTNLTLNDSQTITNNVNAAAASGTATVAHNTTAGNATTGNGQTNVTILNLTGRNVVAANSLLVFINVLGQWVGVIMDAPAGSTSAALGTGVQQSSVNQQADYEVNTDSEITNNIDVNARSGDATVTDNTEAGDATTGDATASVNLANIINSSFSLSDWFGVLFINVFGTWNGSFGVDTAAGEHPPSDSGHTAGASTKPRVFRFVPNGHKGTTMTSVDVNDAVSHAAVQKAVKAAHEKIGRGTNEQSSIETDAPEHTENPATAVRKADLLLPVVGFAVGGTLLGGERVVSRRQRRKTNA